MQTSVSWQTDLMMEFPVSCLQYCGYYDPPTLYLLSAWHRHSPLRWLLLGCGQWLNSGKRWLRRSSAVIVGVGQRWEWRNGCVGTLGWSGAGMQGRGKREYPKKTCRQAASSSIIPTCENPGVNPLKIEPGSSRLEASSLATAPPLPPLRTIINFQVRHEMNEDTNYLLIMGVSSASQSHRTVETQGSQEYCGFCVSISSGPGLLGYDNILPPTPQVSLVLIVLRLLQDSGWVCLQLNPAPSWCRVPCWTRLVILPGLGCLPSPLSSSSGEYLAKPILSATCVGVTTGDLCKQAVVIALSLPSGQTTYPIFRRLSDGRGCCVPSGTATVMREEGFPAHCHAPPPETASPHLCLNHAFGRIHGHHRFFNSCLWVTNVLVSTALKSQRASLLPHCLASLV
ncbi:hypothetical protein PR048_029306 [Dryococelus australis]|uniref:Uncharacterized protein n=1 Tax=Dryococelus australis TaxID=614101 RepID=A0ABQ9GCZ4_9NEOP|nr:hypothetical protein PR048_029306 [Dryococelus australis]